MITQPIRVTKLPTMKFIYLPIFILFACNSPKQKPTPDQQMIVNDVKYSLNNSGVTFSQWSMDTIKQNNGTLYKRYTFNIEYDSADNNIHRLGIYTTAMDLPSITTKFISAPKK